MFVNPFLGLDSIELPVVGAGESGGGSGHDDDDDDELSTFVSRLMFFELKCKYQ